jgi:cytochrome c-type biogenesis protein
MPGTDLTLLVAFVAGLASFLAPCVLPLIPGYLAYLAGTTVEGAVTRRRDMLANAACFVLGFSTVFAALGVALNTVLEAVAYDAQMWVSRAGGVVVIFFGLYLTGLLKIGWLNTEHKLNVTRKFSSRYVTSFVFGAAFAAGWTPCVGAALGAILGLAAAHPGSAFALLLAYALGLGLPFLVVALFAAPAAAFIRRHGAALRWANIVFGVLLVGLGILIFTQQLSRIANFELLNRILL